MKNNHMPEEDNLPRLKTYTEEEIEAFLDGDRRIVNRLLLHGLNNLAIVLIHHAEREEEIFAGMGDTDKIKKRSEWIDAQITKTNARSDMMNKVATSATAWALIAFLGYIVHAIWEYSVTLIKTKSGTH
jgi:hypothetical protein